MKLDLQKTGQNLLLAVASLAVALLIFEVFLRAIGYTYSPMNIKVEGARDDWRHFHSFTDDHFVYDPVLFWRPRNGHSVFNSQGFRGPELDPAKPPGEVRVFAIGDSNTLGWAGRRPDEANWPLLLGARLAADRPAIRTVNAAAWGYSSYQGLRRFEEVLAYEPDLVLISFGANDAHRVAVSDADYAPPPLFGTPFFRLRTGHLMIAFWSVAAFGGPRAEAGELVPRVSVAEYRANLHRIVDLAAENGVACFLLTRPYLGKSDHPRAWKTYAPDYLTARARWGGSGRSRSSISTGGSRMPGGSSPTSHTSPKKGTRRRRGTPSAICSPF